MLLSTPINIYSRNKLKSVHGNFYPSYYYNQQNCFVFKSAYLHYTRVDFDVVMLDIGHVNKGGRTKVNINDGCYQKFNFSLSLCSLLYKIMFILDICLGLYDIKKQTLVAENNNGAGQI